MDISHTLREFIAREMRGCTGGAGSTLSRQRTLLKKKYLGYGYEADAEREERGFSTYVDRTVMETVEWAKPGLMRVFAGTEVIRFDPRSPEQEEDAANATLYVNQAVFGPRMFRIVHDVLTDGLYQRAGWCLAHCPVEERTDFERYEALPAAQAVAVLASCGEDAADEGRVRVARREPSSSSGPALFDIAIRRKVKERTIRLDPVPAEQVVISGDAQDVEHARFLAHWQVKTASDLRREGWDAALVASLPPMPADTMPEARVGQRMNWEEGGRAAEARRHRVYEAWFDFDLDGDGLDEKVKAVFCAEGGQVTVMGWEEWPLYRPPLFAACSVPLPHQAVGLCVADLVSDLQDLRTEMTRQYLDSLALANQGELVVNEGSQPDSVEYDSLLARGVGAVHRIRGDASISPLPAVSGCGDALRGLEMSLALAERRTGISSRTQSLAADSLQNTATGAAIMEEAVNQRLELVARVYAETFFRPLGRYVLHLLHSGGLGEVRMRLKGRFVRFDPRRWDPDMDISVAVGLGTGNRSRLSAIYGQILGIQQAFVQQLGAASPVKMAHIVYTCHRLAEAAGLEAPERFFGTEEEAGRADEALRPAPSGPDPELELKRGRMELERGRFALEKEKQAVEERRAEADIREKEARTASLLAEGGLPVPPLSRPRHAPVPVSGGNAPFPPSPAVPQ